MYTNCQSGKRLLCVSKVNALCCDVVLQTKVWHDVYDRCTYVLQAKLGRYETSTPPSGNKTNFAPTFPGELLCGRSLKISTCITCDNRRQRHGVVGLAKRPRSPTHLQCHPTTRGLGASCALAVCGRFRLPVIFLLYLTLHWHAKCLD